MYKESLDAAVELDEAKYTRKLMKNKSIVDYVRKQQEKNRKDVAKFGNKKVGAYGNEPRFDSGAGWNDMAADEIKLSSMSLNKRKSFDSEAEYEAIARKLGLDKFEPKLEENLDESTLYENKSLKTLVSMGMLSKPNMAKVDRAMRGLKDPDGKALTSLVDDLVKVLSGGEMKEAVELDEKFRSARPSSKEVKMAIGIANDPRYKGGNMTGAVKAIEKIRDGLSKYRDVAAALQKANENLEEAPRRKRPPKMSGDSIAIQRAKDAELNKALGRTKTGRKKPQRTMTSTQRSLASIQRREQLEFIRSRMRDRHGS